MSNTGAEPNYAAGHWALLDFCLGPVRVHQAKAMYGSDTFILVFVFTVIQTVTVKCESQEALRVCLFFWGGAPTTKVNLRPALRVTRNYTSKKLKYRKKPWYPPIINPPPLDVLDVLLFCIIVFFSLKFVFVFCCETWPTYFDFL